MKALFHRRVHPGEARFQFRQVQFGLLLRAEEMRPFGDEPSHQFFLEPLREMGQQAGANHGRGLRGALFGMERALPPCCQVASFAG